MSTDSPQPETKGRSPTNPGMSLIRPLVWNPIRLPAKGGVLGSINAEACLRLRVLGPSPPLTTWAFDLLTVAVPRYLSMVRKIVEALDPQVVPDPTETAETAFNRWIRRYPLGAQKTLRNAQQIAYGGLQSNPSPAMMARQEAVIEGVTDKVAPRTVRTGRLDLEDAVGPAALQEAVNRLDPHRHRQLHPNPLNQPPHQQSLYHRLSCPQHPLNLVLSGDAALSAVCPCGAGAAEVGPGRRDRPVNVEAFLKLEEMNKPRNISPMPPEVAVVLGPQISRAEGVLGHLPWFVKMALPQRERLMSALLGFMFFAETDYATFDKTYGHWFREIEIGVQRPYWTKDIESLVYQVYTRLYSNFIIKHVNGWTCTVARSQRLSGEYATSIGNGSVNHFITWVAFGMPDLADANVCPKPPFVSFHEGDDGIIGCVEKPKSELVAVARAFGLDMTCDWTQSLDNIKFTGRYHYDYNGEVVSLCGFWRTMQKFHLSTCSFNCNPRDFESERIKLLGAKALSRLVIDYHTPVVGAMAWAFLRRTRQSGLALQDIVKTVKATGNRAIAHHAFLVLLGGAVYARWDQKPYPPFDRVRAGFLQLQEGVPSIESLETIHWEWIDYGRGLRPEQPDPLVNPPRSGEANHLELE